jgi:hypothetical protein
MLWPEGSYVAAFYLIAKGERNKLLQCWLITLAVIIDIWWSHLHLSSVFQHQYIVAIGGHLNVRNMWNNKE